LRALPPLRDAVLVRRYKRFLADVRFRDGSTATVHCPNPGAMTGLAEPGSAILVSDSGNPRRKLRFTWELVRAGRTWVCVNTAVANRVVGRWLDAGRLLPGYREVRREVARAGSRFDFELDGRCIVEVKTVTLKTDGMGAFPDAITERGRRHVETLAGLRGTRRVLLYFVARGDVRAVRPADEIDPAYGAALRAAIDAGVEVLAVRARFSRDGVRRGPLLDVIV
jgi:sugar fermentation stimulation protein A